MEAISFLFAPKRRRFKVCKCKILSQTHTAKVIGFTSLSRLILHIFLQRVAGYAQPDACWVCQVSLWGRWLAELKQQTGWFESCAKVPLATMVNYTRESKRRFYSLENSPWKKTEITKELRCNSGNTPWKRKKHLGSYQFLGSWFCGVALISETWLYFFHMIAITWLIGRTDPQILDPFLR